MIPPRDAARPPIAGRPLGRRGLLAGLAALACAQGGAARAASADAFPDAVTLLVAGPSGGWLDGLSRGLANALRRYMPGGTTLGRAQIGGVDGVTAANQFAAQTSLDGSLALLMPGATPLAWMVGDSRVHFDPGRWLPVVTRIGPAIVVGRAGTQPQPGEPWRVAGGSPADPAIAAMLAFDLLGAVVQPVFGLDDDRTALDALAGHAVDAVLLRHEPPPLGASLRPLCALGVPQGDGFGRDPALPNVPTLVEYAALLGRGLPRGPRFDAWQSAAAAAQLRYALVLPALTPPSAVSLWRMAGNQAVAAATDGPLIPGTLQTGSLQVGALQVGAPLMQALAANGPALLDLRAWMDRHLGFQPG